MARQSKKKNVRKDRKKTLGARLRRLVWRGLLGVAAVVILFVLAFAVINPPVTPYMLSERGREGPLTREWVAMEDIAPVMARSAVAAEDANYCLH